MLLNFLKHADKYIPSVEQDASTCQYLVPPGNTSKYLFLCMISPSGLIKSTQSVHDRHKILIFHDNNQNRTCTKMTSIQKGSKCLTTGFHTLNDMISQLQTNHPIFELIQRVTSCDTDDLAQEVIHSCRAALEKEIERLKQNAKKDEEYDIEEMLEDTAVILENYQRISTGSGLLVHNDTAYITLAKALNAYASQTNGQKTQTDMFGDTGVLTDEPWKPIRVKGFGPVQPYARNNDTKAYAFHGLNSVDACPVTLQTKQQLHANMSFLTHELQRDKTWTISSNARGRQLIICFPTKPVNDTIDTTDQSSSLDQLIQEQPLSVIDPAVGTEETLSLRGFCEKAQETVKALTGTTRLDPSYYFELIVLRKSGDGATLTECEMQIDFETLSHALGNWTKANSNAINTTFKFGEDHVFNNKPISPLEAVKILNRRWTINAGIDGNDKNISNYGKNITSSTFSVGDLLRLYLYQDKDVARKALKQIAKHHVYLMLDVKSRYVEQRPTRIGNSIRDDVLTLPSLINILFLVTKGQTMSDMQESSVPFMMGRVIGYADKLQKQWYFSENKDLPNKFVGSSCTPGFLRGHAVHRQWINFFRRIEHLMSWGSKITDEESEQKLSLKQGRIMCRLIQKQQRLIGEQIPTSFDYEEIVQFTQGRYSS